MHFNVLFGKRYEKECLRFEVLVLVNCVVSIADWIYKWVLMKKERRRLSIKTDEEFYAIKRHSTIGYDVLREMSKISDNEKGARW